MTRSFVFLFCISITIITTPPFHYGNRLTSRKIIYAYEELAKYYEHHTEDLEMALSWTQEALVYLNSMNLPSLEKMQWKPEFLHRLQRLQRKFKAQEESKELDKKDEVEGDY